MIDIVKKTMFAGIGLAAMTKDKIEELARDVAKSADLPAERGQQFVEEVTQRAEAARKDLEQKIHQVVNDRLASMKPARQDEVDQLKTRVDALERKFGAAAD